MSGPGPGGCPFCAPDPGRIVLEGGGGYALWDGFPVSPGHCLLIPRRHVPTWWEATEEERADLMKLADQARHHIDRLYRPDGYNLGLNAGEAAGQTIFHLHLHLIPRYRGDLPDPRGGVRAVIPHKANYLSSPLQGAPHPLGLVRGGDDPLYPHLRQALERATRVDLLVAFIRRSGWRRIENPLRDLLSRGGRIRLLTGDYLDVTDPDALEDILKLAEETEEGSLEARVFESRGASFHPKAYLTEQPDGQLLVFVGSSNLSDSALGAGVEWNYRTLSSRDPEGVAEVVRRFEDLYVHPQTRPLEKAWIEGYRDRRPALTVREKVSEAPFEQPPGPHPIQEAALAALAATRRAGHRAGLVVLATGLGKTWLAAFDSQEFRRVLFVAHREEILSQARRTFQRIRPRARIGTYQGGRQDPGADLVFASIQTLSRERHLSRFPRDRFDYVIIDEFHHASAMTYRRLIEHFQPQFMLGLTATPERTDGGDLLALCGQNLVYRCDLAEGVSQQLLAPFHYFGVPDEVDYTTIPWRSRRFDAARLEAALATQARALNALEQLQRRGGKKTVAFCASVPHARFMRDFFNARGLRTAAVHSGPDSDPRSTSLERLAEGALDVIFAVDMFNEGVDLPDIDTVMMLRPTESRILWLQQLGRGLRRAPGKERLTVIDYIGNHRSFLVKAQALFNLPSGDQHITRALDLLASGDLDLPPGCEITYDLEAVDLLRKLLRVRDKAGTLELFYQDFRDLHPSRPRAVEAWQEGCDPRLVRGSHSSWLRFVASQGDLSPEEAAALNQAERFLSSLEREPMTRSYKMLLLQALLEEEVIPGEIPLGRLTEAFIRVAARSPRLSTDLSIDLKNKRKVQALLISMPIKAWTGGFKSQASEFFTYEDEVFKSRLPLEPSLHEPFQTLCRELVEWRLAEYLDRKPPPDPSGG